MPGKKEKEEKTCIYKEVWGEKLCGRPLYDDEYCIFHSEDIERKKAEFNDKFWSEFESQNEHEDNYNFEGFVFPGDISFNRKIFEKQVSFTLATFYGKAFFRQAKFSREADFEIVKFFGDADFVGAQFSGRTFFRQTKFSGEADFRYAKFFSEMSLFEYAIFSEKTNFLEAQFSKNAIFKEANLKRANFERANLQGADLRGANLNRANLQEADLQGAHLQNSDLQRANLRGANFEDCNVLQAKYNRRGRYQGIKLTNCSGSPRFVRTAKDQEYIEELRSSKFRFYTIYLPWLILADCGRSLLLWASWALSMALFFAWKFFSMGPGAFTITNLKFSFETMVYYSVVTFTTLGFGDVTPNTVEASSWVMAEVVLGYIMLGGLISILANKLARRS